MNKIIENINSLKIGVDLDETLCYTIRHLLEYHKLTIGNILLEEKHISDYYIYKIPGISLKTQEEAVKIFREIYYNDFEKFEINPIEGAKEKLEELKNKGLNLNIVTARDGHLFGEYTDLWLKKYFPEIFSKIHHANNSGKFGKVIPKSELCKENGIEIMIEDNMDYALELAYNGIKTFLLEKAWNYKRPENHRNIIKVEGWENIII
ncbi:MAG: HAD hydrolase-like protein [Candidatus Gracilibacteria bacterium]|nr:HAD hydrolase-like protein [Candidatus Gracilibacteria bacterium]